MCVGGCRSAAGVADFLGESFGCLKLGSLCRGAEHCDARCAQPICDPSCKGRLGPDDDKVNRVFSGKFSHGAGRFNVERGAIREQGNAGVAWRDNQFVAFRVLADRPCQRMFPPAAAKDQDIHDRSPSACPACPRLLGSAQFQHNGARWTFLKMTARRAAETTHQNFRLPSFQAP